MLYPECLAGLLLALALIRSKETVLIMSTDPSLPDGLVTEEAEVCSALNDECELMAGWHPPCDLDC